MFWKSKRPPEIRNRRPHGIPPGLCPHLMRDIGLEPEYVRRFPSIR